MQLSKKSSSLCFTALLFAITANAQGIPTLQPTVTPTVQPINISAEMPPSPPSVTALKIQKINEDMTVLQAQLNQLELQFKVATKKRDLIGLNGANSGFSSFDAKNGNPAVVSVAGLKGKLEAVLVFPGGAVQNVKEGDVIDTRRVIKVTANEVVLSDLKGKSIQRLAFGTSATVREPALQNNGMQSPMANQTSPMYR